MHNTAIEQNQSQTETPKRYQCRHIFTDGQRCGSPCLRGESLCYYHHTTRKPAHNPRARRSRRSTFEIPLPEDRSAIQHTIGQVLQRIAANDIDPRRAGLLLYGLQIASLNLPKPQKDTKSEPEPVEEITADPELGLLAPPAEVGKAAERKSVVALLIEKMLKEDQHAPQESAAPKDGEQPTSIPTLHGTHRAWDDGCLTNAQEIVGRTVGSEPQDPDNSAFSTASHCQWRSLLPRHGRQRDRHTSNDILLRRYRGAGNTNCRMNTPKC